MLCSYAQRERRGLGREGKEREGKEREKKEKKYYN
jgi:hypothetical protein